jgi:hypothetical protein
VAVVGTTLFGVGRAHAVAEIIEDAAELATGQLEGIGHLVKREFILVRQEHVPSASCGID